MLHKKEYEKFCDENNVPVFSQPWWLDIVAGKDNWDVFLYKKGGTIQATMPFAFTKMGKYINIEQPMLTEKNGIYIKYPNNQKYTSKLSFEKKIIKYFIEEIEKLNLVSYSQIFDYNFTNWLPFYWNNYKQTSRYTYVIEDTSDLESVYNNIDSTTKNLIRKAEKIVDVYEDLSIEEFYKINSMTFTRKGMKVPYPFDVIKKIDEECDKRDCRKILYAKDKEGNIHGAIYVIWDKDSMYYLFGGINPDFKYSNCTSLLLKSAIKIASEKQIKFDFEGSMNEGIEKFFSSFGGTQKQCFTISKNFRFSLKKSIYLIIDNSNNLKSKLKKILKK